MRSITPTDTTALAFRLSRTIVVFEPKNSDGADDGFEVGITDGLEDGDMVGMADKVGIEEGCVDGTALILGRNVG
jgi:hypothetical protein